MSNLPKGAVLGLHKIAGVAASQRIAGPFSTTAELKALTAAERVDRMAAIVVPTAGDPEVWGFVESSSSSAGANVLVPDDTPTTGRWLRQVIAVTEVALANGKVLIGDAQGVAAAQTVSGDATLSAAGALTIATGAVTNTKIGADAVNGAKIADDAVDSEHIADGAIDAVHLADGAGVAALLTAGLGSSAAVDHADSSPVELLAADPTNDRAVIVIAICTETLAGDNEPLFNAGWDADPDGLIDETLLAGATAGDVFFGAGNVPATNAINVTVADGGDPTNDAGAFAFTVLALPAA